MKRILFISDSLAADVHPRGIFTFSTNLLKILHSAGYDIFILTERVNRYSISARIQRRTSLSKSAVVSPAAVSHFHHYSGFRRPRLMRLIEHVPLVGGGSVRTIERLWFSVTRHRAHRPDIIIIDPTIVDFLPFKSKFAQNLKGLAVVANIYQRSRMLSLFGKAGPKISAQDFDIVIVDTPLNIRVVENEKVVQVIHDLIPLTDPTYSGRFRDQFATTFPYMLKHYQNVLFVSHYTGRKFAETFPRVKARSLVYYPRVDQPVLAACHAAQSGVLCRPAVAQPDQDNGVVGAMNTGVDNELVPSPGVAQVGARFALLIVSNEPRKNIANALEAAILFPDDLDLVVIGQVDLGRYGSLVAAANRAKKGRIRSLGYVSATEKSILLRTALCVIVPSFSEGFGLPIAEAFAHDTAVACADNPLFREVAGEHAEYFDPYSPISIAHATAVAAGKSRLNGALASFGERYSIGYGKDELVKFMEQVGSKAQP